MIYINGEKVEFTSFPDKTSSMRIDPEFGEYRISWLYDGDHECILLWYLVHHIKKEIPKARVALWMPYIPNARMDRVKNYDEVFTLKWFAKFLNCLELDYVGVLDPHSRVSEALIDKVGVVSPTEYISNVMTELDGSRKLNVLLCYPDEGAAKRYSEELQLEYVFCIKHRDWRTGKIEGLELANQGKVKGRNILIVDDICSRGGTFTHTARALKEAGAKEIFLYVTHCEDTIFKGSILTDGLISHVFTTDSIFRGSHEKITVSSVVE